jgi:hypothetical protein
MGQEPLLQEHHREGQGQDEHPHRDPDQVVGSALGPGHRQSEGGQDGQGDHRHHQRRGHDPSGQCLGGSLAPVLPVGKDTGQGRSQWERVGDGGGSQRDARKRAQAHPDLARLEQAALKDGEGEEGPCFTGRGQDHPLPMQTGQVALGVLELTAMAVQRVEGVPGQG